MTIVRTVYRPKRAPRRKAQAANIAVPTIVTPKSKPPPWWPRSVLVRRLQRSLRQRTPRAVRGISARRRTSRRRSTSAEATPPMFRQMKREIAERLRKES